MSNRALAPVNVPWAAADPAGPNLHAGDLYANSGTGKLRLYSGAAWADVATAGGAGTPATTVQTESGLDVGQVGTSTNYAREDHRHPITNLVDFGSTQTVNGQKTFSGDVTFAAGGFGTGAGTMMQRGISASTIGTNNNVAGLVMSNPNAANSSQTAQVPGVIAFAGNYWTGAASAAWSSTISGYRKTASLNAILVTTDVFELGGAVTVAGLTTASGGLAVPAGQALTTGTRSVVTGTRTTTTNASDTVELGTFATTGGAIELRVHAHLAAPASGATASVTKVYEIAAGSLMGTVSTWYLCLPADASANAAATNDFALEVQRTAAGTFQFRFRQKSIGVSGSIAFVVETLGDTVVVFTPSTTVTAAPAAVSTPHPSNAFTAAAGNVGIGTDAPTSLLHVNGTLNATQVQDSGSRVYSAANPPPYPVTTVAGRAGAVTLTAADIASGTLPGAYTVTGALAVGGTLSGAGIETMEYGLRAGFAITGGGQLSFDASSNFGWSTRFIVIGVGNSASSSTSGYFAIDMPTTGAVAVAGGAGARNWSAAGVAINIWEALWYRLPIGSTFNSVPGNFLVTTYTGAMTPPSSDYVLLAVRNGDDGLLKTCVGEIMATGQIVGANPSVFSVAGRTGSVALTAADIGGGTFPGSYTFTNAPNSPGGYSDNGTIVYSGAHPQPITVAAATPLAAAMATFSAETGLTNLNDLSLTVVAGKRYRVHAVVRWSGSVANDNWAFNVRDGGASAPTAASTLVQFAATQVSSNFAAGWTVTNFSFDITPNALSAGTHRLGLFMVRLNGTGVATVGSATAGHASRFTIEDVGT